MWANGSPHGGTIKPLYNDLNKMVPVRIVKHRSKIISITFPEKYLLGRNMPADNNSKRFGPNTQSPLPIPTLASRRGRT